MKLAYLAAGGLLLVVSLFLLATRAPYGLRLEYRRTVAERPSRAGRTTTDSLLHETDLAHLPAPVQRYVRRSGAVGQPKVHRVWARFRGRIRSGPDARWMSFTGEQVNVQDPAARYFYMDATLFGLPIQVLHVYEGSAATMRVKVAGLLPMVNAAGPEMDRSETVTLLNDMCWLAPATLISPSISWTAIDDHSASARYTNAGHVIDATLYFNDADELVDFVSFDRSMASPDGRQFTPARWRTPLGPYARFGAVLLSASGDARWQTAAGEYTYIELELLDVRYNDDRQIDNR